MTHRLTRVRRRRAAVLVSAVMAVALAAGCSQDAEPEPSAVSGDSSGPMAATVGIYEGLSGVTTHAAVEEGIFVDHDLDAEIVRTASAPEMVAIATAGDVDIFPSSVNVLASAVASGECFVVLKQLTGNWSNIIGQPDLDWPNAGKGLDAMKDLEGRSLSVTSRGGGVEIWARHLLESAGVNPDSVTFVATGGLPSTLAAYENKQVDAVVDFPPFETLLGEGTFEMLYQLTGDDSPLADLVSILVASRCEFTEQQPETVLAYCEAIDAAAAYAHDEANRARMEELTVEHIGIEANLGASVWIEVKSVIPASLNMTKAQWEKQRTYLPAEDAANLPEFDDVMYAPCQG